VLKRLENKVALVTGGSSGIGRATALSFAREGANVVVSGRSRDGCDETLQMIKESGGEAISLTADITKADEVAALINRSVETYGKLDCAFNNGGVMGDKAIPTTEYPEDLWDLLIDTNLKGTWLCMKYEIPHMLRNNGGSIVNMSSVVGLVGIPGWAAYVATKHGIVGLTKSVALEYAQANIRVNVICPGTIRTPMLDRITGGDDPQFEAMVSAAHPMGRIGTPEEVAEAALWLCSDATSFITGHSLGIDGGWTAQ
jgi:NAD(P)-dependent dehydrogenase (short-subunit alcohol dehydrogenase family)